MAGHNPGAILRALRKATEDIKYLSDHMDEVDNDVIIDHFQRTYALIRKVCAQLGIQE